MQRPIPPEPSPWELNITDPADHQTFNPAATIVVQGTITGPDDGSAGNIVVTAVSAVLDQARPQALSFSLTGPLKYNFSGTVGPILFGQHTITVAAKLSNRTSVEDTVLVGAGPAFCQPAVVWQNWAGAAGVATGSVTPAMTCTPHSLADLIQSVREAEAANLHVHPYCTEWSFSDAAITSDNMVDMRQLNRPIQKVQQALSSAAPDSTLLYHVEAGITLRDLYTKLNDFYPPPPTGTSFRSNSFITLELTNPHPNEIVQAGQVSVAGGTAVKGTSRAHPHSIVKLTVQVDNGPVVDETGALDDPVGSGFFNFGFFVQVPTLGQHAISVTATDDRGNSLSVTTQFSVVIATRFALQTMTGSGSISLGGAISTGSHASDKLFELTQFMPPLADNVLAIHLVGIGGTQYWIEPSSGITDPAKLARLSLVPDGDPTLGPLLPENIIYDDSTFEAVLVSFGCMGVIYAVVLRVFPQYDLKETSVLMPWSAFKSQAEGRYINDPNNRFLQVVIDPYIDSNGQNQCLVITRNEGDATDMLACKAGDLPRAVKNMVLDMYRAYGLPVIGDTPYPIPPPLPGWQAWQVAETLDSYAKEGKDLQGVIKAINFILEQAPELRPTLVQDYLNIVTAWWPTGTCGGASHKVMDTEIRGAKGPNATTGGYSIEVSFPALNAQEQLAFTDIVDALIAAVNGATNTFLGGWLALRFTGATRASLGMQQWGLTCAIEISTLPLIDGEQDLLDLLLEIMLAHKGLPHWGQLIDRTVPGHGSFYSRFQEWRNIYAKFSNNFATRTFENNLSARWQLTAPDPITMPVEVPALVGKTWKDAQGLVGKDLKLTPTPVPVDPSEKVLLQRPLAGCRVPPGWTVNVTVG